MKSFVMEQQVRMRLEQRHVRYTKGRQRVIAALSRAVGPRSAAELHNDMGGNMPVSSLYRSLAVMADADVLAPHHGAKAITRYELAEWLMGHHHHLVCVACGGVDDVALPPDLEATLERLVSAVAGSGNFTATGHALEIDRRCTYCA